MYLGSVNNLDHEVGSGEDRVVGNSLWWRQGVVDLVLSLNRLMVFEPDTTKRSKHCRLNGLIEMTPND